MSHLDRYYKDLFDLDMIVPLNGSHRGRRRTRIHCLQTCFQEEQKVEKHFYYKNGTTLPGLLKGKQLL